MFSFFSKFLTPSRTHSSRKQETSLYVNETRNFLVATNALRVCNPLNIETTLMREWIVSIKELTLSPDGLVGPQWHKKSARFSPWLSPVSFAQLLPKKTTPELEIYKPRPSVGISAVWIALVAADQILIRCSPVVCQKNSGNSGKGGMT